MNLSNRWYTWCLGLVAAVLVAGGAVLGQDAKPAEKPVAPAEKAAPTAAPAEAKPAAKPAAPAPAGARAPGGPYRKLAPGVLITIPPAHEAGETFNRQDMVELLAVDPKFEWAKNVPFRRNVWGLELQFKPVRMIYVDVPQPSGLMQRKLIYYLIYSVTNTGKVLQPTKAADGTYEVKEADQSVRFAPQFLLEIPDLDKRYPDRIIPVALGPINLREDPKRKIYNTAEMVRDIQPGETVWGVATWEDLDPRLGRFSIYIHGLTNAYRWTDEPGKYQPDSKLGTGRRLYRKALKLNFWRPGDENIEKEDEIRYGIPGQVDYEWVYR